MGVAWSSRECVHGHMCKYARDHAGARSTYTHLDTRHDNKSYIMCVTFTTNQPATFKIGLQPTLWQFFYWHMRNDDVCQWTNCHSKTWQELLQKITNIISRQGKCRRLFSSATPHPLFFVILIIKYPADLFNQLCATNITVTWGGWFLNEMD